MVYNSKLVSFFDDEQVVLNIMPYYLHNVIVIIMLMKIQLSNWLSYWLVYYEHISIRVAGRRLQFNGGFFSEVSEEDLELLLDYYWLWSLEQL